jgi:succinyl-CoA synthetase alpha subunit
MTIRNLDKLFSPASVAVIGASERAGSIGSVLTRNLVTGGFAGPVWGVNPHYDTTVHGAPCFPSVAALPAAPDLAIIVTPMASSAPGLVAELGARGTRAAVVISASREDAEGAAIKTAILQAARPYTMRIVGPNCLGVMVPATGLNASFAHLPPIRGRLAFVTQSGAIVTSMIDWAQSRDIGFSHVVSLGDMSDVDIGDMLDYLANDGGTDAILLYIEGITGARKFVSAARAAARTKPVIVVKGGRFAAGARAAATHTGAMMGRDEVYDAVFRRTGMVRVYTLTGTLQRRRDLSRVRKLRGERLAILTNGGGLAVLAADALASLEGTLATLGEHTLAALDALLPPNWSRANPVDVIGDASPAPSPRRRDPRRRQGHRRPDDHPLPDRRLPGPGGGTRRDRGIGRRNAAAAHELGGRRDRAGRARAFCRRAGPDLSHARTGHPRLHARGEPRPRPAHPDGDPGARARGARTGTARGGGILAHAREGRPWLDSSAETRAVLKAYGFAVIEVVPGRHTRAGRLRRRRASAARGGAEDRLARHPAQDRFRRRRARPDRPRGHACRGRGDAQRASARACPRRASKASASSAWCTAPAPTS